MGGPTVPRPPDSTAEGKERNGVSLAFREVEYVVRVTSKQRGSPCAKRATETKAILHGVSGACKPGQLLAIMGPSGAGKTSLLDVLAGRALQSSGELCLGSKAGASAADIRRIAAYVQQDDAIMASQTVREALNMSALLTLPRTMAKADKLKNAERVLRLFQLDGCAETMVGDPVGKVKGLSGGERKRCAVGMAAVRQPQILFLDEPTSGLDAYKAYLLITSLRKMAREWSAPVVCTIHQPSSDIFALFDDLLLLLDGRAVFGGPASVATEHFASAGFPCPQYANPADFFFMHVLTCADGTRAPEERRTKLEDAYKASDHRAKLVEEIQAYFEGGNAEGCKNSSAVSGSSVSVEKSSLTAQFSVLFVRGANDLRRNPMRGKAPVVQSIVMSLIVSLIWLQVGTDQSGVQDRVGVLFFLTTNLLMSNVISVLTTFANERGAVIREQENGLYSTLPYFVARVLVDLPIKIFSTFVFGTISYWLVGFQADGGKYLLVQAALQLEALAGNSLGLLLACAFPDVAVALAVAPLFLLPLIMFSGFLTNAASIPVYFKWAEWLSPAKYAFSAIAQVEFTGLGIHCKPEQIRMLPTEDGRLSRVCPIQSGEDFLDGLNIQEFLTVTNCLWLLALLGCVFTCLAYAGIVSVSRRKLRRVAV